MAKVEGQLRQNHRSFKAQSIGVPGGTNALADRSTV